MNPVIAMLIGVVVMMVLVICTRMHAFPSLIISAILIAVLSGNYLLVGTGNEGGNLLSVAISTVTGGFGGTMTSIGIVIGFGCIMGIFLEKSGAAKRMAITILKLVGVKRADVVLGLTGFVVSIPVFCDSGFVILSSLAKEFSRLTKKSMVGLGGILGMGLYITHFMVPPTPGPLAVVSTFQNEGINIDLGMFIIAGLLFSIPLFIFSVFLFRWFGNKYPQFVVPYEIDRSKYTEAQLKVLDKIDAKIKAGKELENEDFTELLSTDAVLYAGAGAYRDGAYFRRHGALCGRPGSGGGGGDRGYRPGSHRSDRGGIRAAAGGDGSAGGHAGGRLSPARQQQYRAADREKLGRRDEGFSGGGPGV